MARPFGRFSATKRANRKSRTLRRARRALGDAAAVPDCCRDMSQTGEPAVPARAPGQAEHMRKRVRRYRSSPTSHSSHSGPRKHRGLRTDGRRSAMMPQSGRFRPDRTCFHACPCRRRPKTRQPRPREAPVGRTHAATPAPRERHLVGSRAEASPSSFPYGALEPLCIIAEIRVRNLSWIKPTFAHAALR